MMKKRPVKQMEKESLENSSKKMNEDNDMRLIREMLKDKGKPDGSKLLFFLQKEVKALESLIGKFPDFSDTRLVFTACDFYIQREECTPEEKEIILRDLECWVYFFLNFRSIF